MGHDPGVSRRRAESAPLLAPGERLPAAALAGLVLVFALLATFAWRQVGSLDVGFHLKAGEHLLAGRGWPRTDPFTYTLADRPYIDTSWGYQVIAALAAGAGGAPGLVVLHLAAALLTFWLVYRTARLAPVDPASLVLLLLAGVVASEMRLEVRPEVFSWLLLAGVLYLLHRDAAGLRSPLWALPAIHLLWANVHGLFVLGWIAVACFAAGAAIEGWLGRGDGWARARRLWLWGAASVAATVVNPYGLRGTLFPFTLGTRLQEKNTFGASIGEFASPFSLRLSDQFPFYPRAPIAAFLVLAVLAAIASVVQLRRRPSAALLVPPFLVLSGLMIRNLPLLAVACLPAIVWGVPASRLLGGLGLRGGRNAAALRVALVGGMGLAIVLGLRVATDAYYIASRRPERFGCGWNRLALPVDAADHARRAGIPPRVLNHLNFGGYLMWALPQPVFIDGRLEVVGERFFEEYRRTLASQEGIEACVERYGVRWIVFPYATNPGLLNRLGRDRRWRLAWFDHLAVIFVREGPGAAAWVAPEAAAVAEPGAPRTAPPALELRSLPGLGGAPRPGRASRWLSGCYRRQRFPSEEHFRGLFHLFRGEPERAAALFAAGIRASDGAYYELYQNLGGALARLGRRDEARACYRVVLGEDPGNRVAREGLAGR